MGFDVKKILVPVDFSETGNLALEHASFMARLIKADLTLLHVMPVNDYHFSIPEPILHIEERERLSKVVETKLNELSEATRENYGIRVNTLSASGQIAHEVVSIAQDEKFDLIIMGTHGAKGFEEMFIGSNAHKVVSVAPCPVITVQTHAKKLGYNNILLPIDRSIHSREKVKTAIGMAKYFHSKIHILGLLESDEASEYDKLQIVLDQVQDAIEKAEVNFSRSTVEGSNLAHEALKAGQVMNSDLIIIMTDHESEMTGIFMGPVAKQIVNHSRIPVMSIKPSYHNFQSVNLGGGSGIY
ncbi:MAG: universal stress protein [Bacteroidia bacterium]